MLIGFVGDDPLLELTFAGAGLRRQDMAGGGVMAHNLAGTGFLEAFGRTLMGLHLGHILSWEFVRMAMNRRTGTTSKSVTCRERLKNPLLLGETADGADVGNHKGEKVLVVVPDDVVDPADLKAKAATIGVVADLIKAKRQAIQPDIVEDIRSGVKAPPEAVPVPTANHNLIGCWQQGRIRINVRVTHGEKVFRIADAGPDAVIEKLLVERIPIGTVVDA